MKTQFEGLIRTYLTLFVAAVIIALTGRFGLLAMDLSGLFSYNYMAASGGTILDQVCSILTGPSLFALLFLAGLVMSLSTVSAVLYGVLYAKGEGRLARPQYAILIGLLTFVVGVICILIVINGIFSSVQVAVFKNKFSGGGESAIMVILFITAIITLLAASYATLCACLAQALTGISLMVNIFVATAVCGFAVMFLAIGAFASLNVADLQPLTVAWWLGLSTIVNVLILVICSVIALRRA